jgi:tetratricopeptide (TPR) repeat protein
VAFPGCSAAYVSRVEAGQRIPSLQVLRELGKRLGVSADYLATGSETHTHGATPLALLDAEVALRLDDADAADAAYEAFLEGEADRALRSRALEGLGHVAVRRGDPALAVERFRAALEVSGEDECLRPSVVDGLARSYAQLGELAEAIAVLERCLARCEDDPVQYIRFAGLLGAALTDNGNYAEAERLLAKAIVREREVSDPYTRARLLWSEARLRSEQGQHELAARYHEQALQLLRATEDAYAVARSHHALAHVLLNLDRPGEALEQLREGWPLIERAATPREVASYRLEEARALVALGEAEAAGAIALEISTQLEGLHPLDAARSYVVLADVYAALGVRARAREVLELAIEQLEAQSPSRYLVEAYRRLAALLKEEGRSDEALELLERALGVQATAGRTLR